MSPIPLKIDCFVSSVTLMGLKALTMESLDWEPEILRDAFEAFYKIPNLPQRTFDKLNCGYSLVGTNLYTNSIEGFLSFNAIMANMPFEEDEVPFNSLKMVSWGVWEYINLTGEMKNGTPEEQFCPEIVLYVQKAGALAGVSTFPPWLSWAQGAPGSVPDFSSDLTAFAAYGQRQQTEVADINAYVSNRQALLTEELKILQKEGILA